MLLATLSLLAFLTLPLLSTLTLLALLTLLTLLATLPLLAVLTLLALLATLTLLTFLPLWALALLLTTLALLSLLLALLIALLLTVATRVFIEPPPQRIEVVSQLPRAVEILFRTRTVRAARALLRRLQTLGQIIQTALDRTLIRATAAALLTVLLALLGLLPGSLLAILLTLLATLLAILLTILLPIERLFPFANPLRYAIAREPFRRVLQLPRGALLALPLPLAHRPARRLDVLLQTTHRIGQRILSFRQLLASLARVFILRALPATSRQTLHVFRDLTLSRRRLRRTLSQVGNLFLAAGRARLSATLT